MNTDTTTHDKNMHFPSPSQLPIDNIDCFSVLSSMVNGAICLPALRTHQGKNYIYQWIWNHKLVATYDFQFDADADLENPIMFHGTETSQARVNIHEKCDR